MQTLPAHQRQYARGDEALPASVALTTALVLTVANAKADKDCFAVDTRYNQPATAMTTAICTCKHA